MIKRFLKNIFPRVFLKRAFLVYNTFKSSTWDRVFFKKETIPVANFLLWGEMNPFLQAEVDISKFDTIIKEKFSIWTNPEWKQDQFILLYDHPGWIDPKVGWGVTLARRLIYPSLGFASAPHVHKPEFAEMYFRKRKITALKNVISLRDTGEENYFHFYNDVVAKLYLLEEHKIDVRDFSIVISERLYSKQYFQYVLNNTYLKSLRWHVQQPHEWIKFERAVFCKPFTHTRRYFDKTIELVKHVVPSHDERRVFLTRPTRSLRFIENMSEVYPILRKYNFEVVDTATLNLEQQIELFNQCRFLVAIHGAGIANIIFRSGKALSLLELIQPSHYIPFHYSMLCKMYNYTYDVILGIQGRNPGNGGFIIDPAILEVKLKEML